MQYVYYTYTLKIPKNRRNTKNILHSTHNSIDLHSTNFGFNGLHIVPDRQTGSLKKSAA